MSSSEKALNNMIYNRYQKFLFLIVKLNSLLELKVDQGGAVAVLCDLNSPPPEQMHYYCPRTHHCELRIYHFNGKMFLPKVVPLVEDAARLIRLRDGSFAYGGGLFGDRVVFSRGAKGGSTADGFIMH